MLISHIMPSPLNIQEMEASAREKLPREVFDYYAGGAWDLQTLHENQDATGDCESTIACCAM